MAKTPHIIPLPAAFTAGPKSADLLKGYVQRFMDSGEQQ